MCFGDSVSSPDIVSNHDLVYLDRILLRKSMSEYRSNLIKFPVQRFAACPNLSLIVRSMSSESKLYV